MKNTLKSLLITIFSLGLLFFAAGNSIAALAADASGMDPSVRANLESQIALVDYSADLQTKSVAITEDKFDSIIKVNGVYLGTITVKYNQDGVISYNKAVFTSRDKLNWFLKGSLSDQQETPPESYEKYLLKFVHGYYLVKDSSMSYVSYSQDAVHWEKFTTPPWFSDVTYAAGKYWAVDRSCNLFVSTDFKTWNVYAKLNENAYLFESFESFGYAPGHFATDLAVADNKAVITFYNPNETGLTNYGGLAVYDLTTKQLIKPLDSKGSFDGFVDLTGGRAPSRISVLANRVFLVDEQMHYDEPADLHLISNDGVKWSKLSDSEAQAFWQKFQPEAGDGIGVTINGKPVNFDFAPVIENGRTLVPLRMIFESLGIEVGYDAATRTVTGTAGDKVIKIQIDNAQAEVNGKPITLDVPAKILNNRTYVPVRFIAESLGMNVDWDATARVVLIND